MKAPAVLIIGLQETGFNEVKLVQSKGYKALLFKQKMTLQESMEADVPVEVDLNDEAAVLGKLSKLRERYDIQAVYTLNEYRVPLAARLKETLGLRNGLSYEAALNCRSKKRTRQYLAEYGVGSARYVLVKTPLDALAAMRRLPMPVIVKPSNEAGSNLVVRCEEPDQLYDAVDAISRLKTNWVGQAMDEEVLMEEFLDGPEFSVEACTVKGRTTVLAITAKLTEGLFEIGHLVPAPLSAEEEESIRRTVQGALAALGVSDTVTHTEVKLTSRGPRVIEVNARPGGDKIPQLVLAVTGYELRELSLHLALGGNLEDAPRHPIAAPSAAIRFFASETDGTVQLFHPEAAKEHPAIQKMELFIKNGDQVERTTSNYNRLGYFIVHGTAEQNAGTIADEVKRKLQLQVN